MSYQIFTRYSHISGVPTPGSRPRRYRVVDSLELARVICGDRNRRRSRKQVLDGFFYEFADQKWYDEAFS